MKERGGQINAVKAIGVAVLVGILIGRCTAGPDEVVSEFAEASLIPDPPASETRWVSSSALNCRADPSIAGRVVRKLAYSDTVQITQQENGWALVDGAPFCWASEDYLSDKKPAPRPTYTPSPMPVVARRRSSPAPNNGWSCAYAPYCTQISSCEEAYFYYSKCGINRLDGDSDGVPCERVCR